MQASERPMLPPRAETTDSAALAARDEAAAAHTTGAALYGEVEEGVELDQEKLKKALEKEEAFQKAAKEDPEDDRKRKYNSFVSTEVTAEEMEAYRMKKNRSEDPMAKISSDDILPLDG